MSTARKTGDTLLLVVLSNFGAFAQGVIVRGMILKESTPDRIAQVQITDLKTGITAFSDNVGSFNIVAAQGDTLLFARQEYTPLKTTVVNKADMLVYMKPVINLNEVEIKGTASAQEQKEIVNDYRSKGLYFDGRPPLALFNPISGSPLTGLHELLGKDAANERRFTHYIGDDQQAAEIDKLYTPQLVESITNLRDRELVDFMDKYRPQYAVFKTWNDYQLREYIQASFEEWKKGKPKTPASPGDKLN